MPELPEVETIARTLRLGQGDIPAIINKTITGAEVYWEKSIEKPAVPEFKQRIIGQKIEKIGRRAKYFVVTLSKDTLLIHLRMSGDLIVGPAKEMLADHVRVSLILDHEWQLAFNNPRKFGRIWLLEKPQDLFDRLGPEPFDPNLTGLMFWEMLQKRTRQIKPLLLDQGFIAGMGNIYTDEALNLSKIHPLERSNQITQPQAEELLKNIRSVLQEGIRRNGSSIDWVYRGGDYQNHFRVYDRKGEPCPTCGTKVEKIVVGQRGTHFCPECQPTPEEAN